MGDIAVGQGRGGVGPGKDSEQGKARCNEQGSYHHEGKGGQNRSQHDETRMALLKTG